MIRLLENKQAMEVLCSVARCGEYSTQSIDLIANNSNKYLREMIVQLEKERYITKVGSGQIKRLRLLKKGIEAIRTIDPVAAAQYNYVTDNLSYSGSRGNILRSLKLSETRQLMYRADVHTAITDKAPLQCFHNNFNYLPPAAEKAAADQAFEKLPTYFYDSKELKRCDIDGMYKTSFTRVCGMYVTPAMWYGVFNLRGNLCEWNHGAEFKSCVLMQRLIKENSFDYPYSLVSKHSSNIIIGRVPQLANQIIVNTDKARVQSQQKEYNENRGNKYRTYMQLDSTYSYTHYLLSNDTGVDILKILAVPDFKRKLKCAVLPNDCKFDGYLTSGADGVDNNRNFYLVFFDSDLRRLRGFRDGMKILRTPSEKCIVACFAWQAEIVYRCLLPGTKIYTYKMSDIKNALKISE